MAMMLEMIMIEIEIVMIVKIIVVTHSSKYSAIASIVMQSKNDRSIVDAVSLCTIAKHFIIMRTILYVWDRERVCVFYSFFFNSVSSRSSSATVCVVLFDVDCVSYGLRRSN